MEETCQNPPEAFAKTDWLELVGGVLLAPCNVTCNSRTIDYFVVAKALAPMVHDVYIFKDPAWSAGASAQHWPVRLMYDGFRIRTLVRQLDVPKGFSAIQPHGPPEADASNESEVRAIDEDIG